MILWSIINTCSYNVQSLLCFLREKGLSVREYYNTELCKEVSEGVPTFSWRPCLKTQFDCRKCKEWTVRFITCMFRFLFLDNVWPVLQIKERRVLPIVLFLNHKPFFRDSEDSFRMQWCIGGGGEAGDGGGENKCGQQIWFYELIFVASIEMVFTNKIQLRRLDKINCKVWPSVCTSSVRNFFLIVVYCSASMFLFFLVHNKG
jgi:hypothetical protein